MGFVHLHVHTEYSLLDGASRIADFRSENSTSYVKGVLTRCIELGMNSLAITDHGTMYGIIEFYREAKKLGIKPIIGCETYVAPRTMEDKQGADREYAHLILLAKNESGYKNLMKLVSMAFTKGFYYKPRIDYNVLADHAEGLICLSACLAGDIPQRLLANDEEGAREYAKRLKGIFGKDFYIEIQDHGLPEQRMVNPKLIELAKELEIDIAATNDVHYIEKEDWQAQDILMCIQTNKLVEQEDRMRMGTTEFYLKSPEEMAEVFPYIPEALENTQKIADMCNVELDFKSIHLPSFDPPVGKTGREYLNELVAEGFHRRYADFSCELEKRIEYELSTIEKMGYVDYFLIVWDFIHFAKEKGIIVGPGRGSAAGSMVAYCLGITDIDPIKYSLIFERFLNPERISMPDIDIDFCYERRQEVIDYVVAKYGEDKVAQIVTFGTMGARAVIRDVGRVLQIPYGEVDKIAKMIPRRLDITIDSALQISPELQEKYTSEAGTQNLIDMARKLEGLPRHASTHAAGVVISKLPITEYVPLQKNDDVITTQYDMVALESLGLLKMDFLGLRTLTVIREAIEIIAENTGKQIDVHAFPLDDAKVFEMLGEGDTDGVFQLESSGMRQFMKDLKPSSLEDLIAGGALYRPGPMDQIPRYVEGKRNARSIHYDHPLLEPILNVTYGCMVYQEQVMQIVRDAAGYSLGRSDLVRRAMSKKKPEIMDKERKHFVYGLVENGEIIVPGAIRRGIPEDIANKIFDQIYVFGAYAFNKSHAAAYAMVTYWTAFLKRYHPVAFFAAMLNSHIDRTDKIAQYANYCRKNGIKILPPDVNKSFGRFKVEGKNIRFGLGAVKNVGMAVVNAIVEARRSAAYSDFYDFCRRVSAETINKRMLESMIKAGAFDSMGYNRAQLIRHYDKVFEGVAKEKKASLGGQLSLFDSLPMQQDDKSDGKDIPFCEEFAPSALLSMEKEMTGIYIKGHPLLAYEHEIERLGTSTASIKGAEEEGLSVDTVKDGQEITIGGIITSRRKKLTRNDSMMAYCTLEDLHGDINLVIFPSVLTRYSPLLEVDSVVKIKGRVNLREEEEPAILVDEVTPLGAPSRRDDKKSTKQRLTIALPKRNEFMLMEIQTILKKHPGEIPVAVSYDANAQPEILPQEYAVTHDNTLAMELEAYLGKCCILNDAGKSD